MQIPRQPGLGPLRQDVEETLGRLQRDAVLQRIRDRDHTVWGSDPHQISDRLGWLDSPDVMPGRTPQIRDVVSAARRDRYTHALLLGMGGSSLTPHLFAVAFGVAEGHLALEVLDSTDPAAVLERARRLHPERTLYIPATKSGGTVETLSFLKYFYTQAAEVLGRQEAGRHFVTVTDPGSTLAELAARLGFRHVFLNDPTIGGRYSALSCFGLVAAGAVGVDLDRLLRRAQDAIADPQAGGLLGAVLGAGARAGRDKLTLVVSPGVAAFGAWAEQLIAESTGKDGKGILPVDGEPLLAPPAYEQDRLFVHLRLAGDDRQDASVEALARAGHPVLRIDLENLYDLGAQFVVWELATAVAGHLLQINPFDQPNVEAAKRVARQMMQTYRERGMLPGLEPVFRAGPLAVYGEAPAGSLRGALDDFLAHGRPGRSYVALQAYVPPEPATDRALATLRRALLERTRLATTVGYGPRFLHSTGQLHKGDAGHGLFLQLVWDPPEDAAIPEEPGDAYSTVTFGVLEAAQALGDRQALLAAGRRVLRVQLGPDVPAGIEHLRRAIEG
ncbi:MAG: glucose-6-phosphate isomerase [Candidatus Latescibacterota bacterium]